MHDRTGIRLTAMLAAGLLAGVAAWAQPAQRGAPPERIGPVWDFREHPPNPAEVEARERARGLPQSQDARQAQEVDQLYRELTGSDPQAPPPNTSGRETERR